MTARTNKKPEGFQSSYTSYNRKFSILLASAVKARSANSKDPGISPGKYERVFLQGIFELPGRLNPHTFTMSQSTVTTHKSIFHHQTRTIRWIMAIKPILKIIINILWPLRSSLG